MGIECYVNKTFITEQGNRYVSTAVCQHTDKFVLLKTDSESLIKIFFGLNNAKKLKQQIDWIIRFHKRIREDKSGINISYYLLLPSESIINLKSDEVGFICASAPGCSLTSLIRPTTRFTYNWFFNLTGGIYLRLLLGYRIAVELEKIFREKVYIGRFHPDSIFFDPKSISGSGNENVQFTVTEAMSTPTNIDNFYGVDLYYDPLVYKRWKTNSELSDTYTYAVNLFELLTTCHPFKGEEYEQCAESERIEKVNCGELDYIGCDGTQNYNELYDDTTKNFIPQELAVLFRKMFTDGKLSPEKRPVIEDFAQACLKGLNRLCKCSNITCSHEFNYSKEAIRCPYCGEINSPVLIKFFKEVTSTNEILMPYDKFKKYSPIPTVQREIGFIVLSKNKMTVPWRLLDEKLPMDCDATAVSFQFDEKTRLITIINKMERTNIKVGEIDVPPERDIMVGLRELAAERDRYRIRIPQIIPRLETEQYEEQNDEMDLPHYGLTKVEYILDILENGK